jgi:hypothetical protein
MQRTAAKLEEDIDMQNEDSKNSNASRANRNFSSFINDKMD